MDKDGEKFVSIEFNLWHSKYKLLEETNNRLRAQIKELEEKNTIKVIVQQNYYHGRYLEQTYDVGYIKFKVRGNPHIFSLQVDKEKIYKALEEEYVSIKLNKAPWMMTVEDVKNLTTRLEMVAKQSEIVKSLNNEQVMKIPKFIRWLFKIKLL